MYDVMYYFEDCYFVYNETPAVKKSHIFWFFLGDKMYDAKIALYKFVNVSILFKSL